MYDKLFKCTWTTVVSISTVVAVREKGEKGEERATDDISSSMDQRSESSHPRDVNFEFILRGRGSDISTKFSEPIIIPTNLYEGKIGLKGFVCYHSIPNVSQDVNNKILIKVPTTVTTHMEFSLELYPNMPCWSRSLSVPGLSVNNCNLLLFPLTATTLDLEL